MLNSKLAPVELIVLQGTSFCNLNCKYCDLSAESRRKKAVMAMPLVEKLFTDLFSGPHLAPRVTVVWHSGEPLTLPPSYYEEAIERITGLRESMHRSDVAIKFDIQTNGVLINDEWCAFFKNHEAVLDVGVSCDGPGKLHDLYRRNWNDKSSFEQTLRGMQLLRDAGIRYRVIAVVTNETLRHPDEFYDFFFRRRKEIGEFHFNILASGTSANPALLYTSKDRARYYAFYRRLLELNCASCESGDTFEIQNFSQGLGRVMDAGEGDNADFTGNATAPIRSLTIDARGNVTTFYAGLSIDVLANEYGDGSGLSIGNICAEPLAHMLDSAKLRKIMADFAASTRICARDCPYFSVCPGGFELTKRESMGTFAASETVECMIHVQTLTDALVDDIAEYRHAGRASVARTENHMLHIDHAGLEQLQSGIDAFGFGTLPATIRPDVLAGMREEADLCREAIQVEQQSGLRYHATLAPLGHKAARFLGSQPLTRVLTRLFGGSFSLTGGRSCMTFYGEGDFLGPHQDQPAEECAVTIIVYLEVFGSAIRHGQTGLELLVYGETMPPDAEPRLVIPTRAGAIVVGRGSTFFHERKRLAHQERVIALTGCYRHS